MLTPSAPSLPTLLQDEVKSKRAADSKDGGDGKESKRSKVPSQSLILLLLKITWPCVLFSVLCMCIGCHCAGHADQCHSAAADLPGLIDNPRFGGLLRPLVLLLSLIPPASLARVGVCVQIADSVQMSALFSVRQTSPFLCDSSIDRFSVLCPTTTTARVQAAGRGSPLPEAHYLPQGHAAPGATQIHQSFEF
jgi:hypothetical protein